MGVNRATVQRVFLSFVVPVVVSVLASFIIFRVITASSTTLQEVATSYERISSINRLMKTVLDAETGMRGYVITGSDAFLEPYYSANIHIDSELAVLRQLLGDEASQSALGEIEKTLEEWRSEVAEVAIGLRRDVPPTLLSSAETAYSSFLETRRAEAQYRQTASPEALVAWGAYAGETRDALEQMTTLPLYDARAAHVRELDERYKAYARRLLAPNKPPGPNAEADTLTMHLRSFTRSVRREDARLTGLLQRGSGKLRIDKIRTYADTLQRRADASLQANLNSSEASTWQAQIVSFAGPIASAIFGLLAVVMSQRSLNRSVWRLTRVTQDVSNGEFDKRLYIAKSDELGQLAQNFNKMAADLSLRERQAKLFGQMGKLLQTCSSSDELYSITRHYTAELFPDYSGALYLISASRNILERHSSWGSVPDTEEIHAPDACWAIRQGQTHESRRGQNGTGFACAHAPTPIPFESLCIPLHSQNEVLGVFYLYTQSNEAIPEVIKQLAGTIAEQLALAVSNLALRETLRHQSLRDPLTGLFNRRHLEETLDLELHRAARQQEPISLLMLDVDHFKRYNDTFGHDAGDMVLQSLSTLIKQHIRAGDVACRYGGEEFLLVQPGLGLPQVLERAETLRKAVMALNLEYMGKRLGQITISLGVALYPDSANRAPELIKRADEALYRAKHSGRNQVLLAIPSPASGSEPATLADPEGDRKKTQAA